MVLSSKTSMISFLWPLGLDDLRAIGKGIGGS